MNRTFNALVLALALLAGFQAFANEAIESPDINLMSLKAHELARRYGTENVLLVYDIDNTLLTANQSFGGDAWFNWQVGAITSGDKVNSVAPDINGLIEVQSALFAIGKMHAVDSAGPTVFNQLAKEGFNTLLLTSRGSNNRDATERELSRNGFVTAIKPLGSHGIPGKFIPYDLQHIEESCMTNEEAKALKLGTAVSVTLVEGLFMTSGQHKGAMLRSLLCRLHQSVRAVLFIDDTPKNVVRMHDAIDSTAIELQTIRYSKLDSEVEHFMQADKAPFTAQWQRWKATISEIFQ
jgi:hypothetical protein